MDRRHLLASFAGAGLLGTGAALWALPASRPAATASRARWVSLSPAITETAFAMEVTNTLVGRSTWCQLPPIVGRLPPAGTSLEPDLEALAALAPTGVLVEASRGAQIDRISQIAPVESLAWETVEDVQASVARLGTLLGAPDRAAHVAQVFDRALVAAPPAGGARVLLAMAGDDLGRGPLWFIKRNSLHGAAAHAAGLRNAVMEDVSGLPQLSLERLLAINPHAILVLSAETLDDAARDRLRHAFDALTPLAAATMGRVAVIDGPTVLSTGPSIATLPKRLRAAIGQMGLG